MVALSTLQIIAFALAFSLLAYFVNRKIGQRQRLKEIQGKVNAYYKELKEATEKKDEVKLKQLSAREKEVSGLMQEMLFLPFKAMLVILPLFFVCLYLLGFLFSNYVTTLPFFVPQSINVFGPWKNWVGSRGLFILASIFFGIGIELVASRIEKKSV